MQIVFTDLIVIRLDKFSASSSSFGNLDEIRRPVTGYELSSSVPSSPATFMDGKEPAERKILSSLFCKNTKMVMI